MDSTSSLHMTQLAGEADADLRAAAASKMECFMTLTKRLEAINYYHKVLHLGCCSSPRSASGKKESSKLIEQKFISTT